VPEVKTIFAMVLGQEPPQVHAADSLAGPTPPTTLCGQPCVTLPVDPGWKRCPQCFATGAGGQTTGESAVATT
jgi:hypothetical protein